VRRQPEDLGIMSVSAGERYGAPLGAWKPPENLGFPEHAWGDNRRSVLGLILPGRAKRRSEMVVMRQGPSCGACPAAADKRVTKLLAQRVLTLASVQGIGPQPLTQSLVGPEASRQPGPIRQRRWPRRTQPPVPVSWKASQPTFRAAEQSCCERLGAFTLVPRAHRVGLLSRRTSQKARPNVRARSVSSGRPAFAQAFSSKRPPPALRGRCDYSSAP